jgi:signal transduction histidine kinase/CheY-like chemotaxis protein
MDKLCPVSGRIMTERSEWFMRDHNDRYRVQFSLIGNHIIYSHPEGSASSMSTKKSLSLNQQVETYLLSKSRFYVQIENFTELTDFTLDARLTYIQYFRGRPGICGLIFFGVSYLTSLSIRFAAKMYLAGFPIRVVSSYEEAIRLAIELVDKNEGLNPGGKHTIEKETLPHGLKIQSDPSWVIDLEGYRARYELINGHIVHSVGKGVFSRQHIKPVIDMQEKLFCCLDPGRTDYHMIADVSEITGISYQNRLHYTKAQREFWTGNRFETLIFYGGDRFLKAAVYFGRAFVPFRTILADTFEEGLNIIYNSGINREQHQIKLQNRDGIPQSVIETYASDILKYMGTLNLDVDMQTRGEQMEFPSDHPFKAIFDTIDLINYDLNEIAQQRKAGEEKRLELERKLSQAQAMEALGRFSGGIAHDFNNILSGIMGYCELAKLNIHDHPKALSKLEEALKGARRAAGLIHQILLFSRKAGSEKSVYELGPVIREAIELIRPTIPSNIRVVEEISSREKVMVDPARFHQVVMNLCTNAFQAMGPKGGILTVKLMDVPAADKKKADPAIPGQRYVRLDVTDTGSGMTPEILSRVFEPYYTTKDIGKGTGLGLSLVHAIVQEHGGDIQICSDLGKGSVFTVCLPATDQEEELKAPEDRPVKSVKGHEHILIVDDEKSILESWGELLKDAGYSVTEFDDPVKALSEFRHDPDRFDLVVTDLTMPGLTGDLLAKEMTTIRPAIPIILCSGFNDTSAGVNTSHNIIRRFLQKPFTRQPLSEVIREVLDE